MPHVNIPLADPREPGREILGWAWCSRIAIDAEAETIEITVRIYNSQAAAYAAGAEPQSRSYLFAGEDYRAVVIANPQLWGQVGGMADGMVHPLLGGDVIPATLPAWATEES